MILWYFFWWTGLGLAVPFVPVFLKELGFSYTQIGQLSALSALAGFLSQNFIGVWSDRIGKRKPFIIGGSLVMALSYALFPAIHRFDQFVLLYLLLGLGMFTALTTSSALVLDTAPPGESARSFARVRIWGTVGFILMMALGWVLPQALTSAVLFRLIPLVYFLAAISVLPLKESRIETAPTSRAMPWEGFNLLRLSGVPVLLLVVAVLHGCLNGASASLVLWLKTLDAEQRIIHLSFIVSATIEIPFMLSMGKWSDKYGRRPLLAITGLVLPLRLWLYSIIVQPGWVPLVQSMHGLTFSVLAVVPMAYMNDVVPEERRAAGQGLLNATMAGAVALGPYLMGVLADQVGFPMMYRILAWLSAGAGILLLLFLKESNRNAVPAEDALPRPVRRISRPVTLLFDRSPLSRRHSGE